MELGNCLDLMALVLSSQFNAVNMSELNTFKGGIPESVTTLPKLRVLWLPRAGSLHAILLEQCTNVNGLIVSFRGNKISGGLPSELSTKCGAIRALDLAGNRISGVMPANIGLLGALVKMDLSRNLLVGQIPASFKDLKSLKFLSLAGNNLSGNIPSCLGRLRSLEVLDLSSNFLSGNIPKNLVTQGDLATLLLNNNKLSRNIPDVTPLASLTIFNISFNNLSGPLPMNMHLMTCNMIHGNPSLPPCGLSTLSNTLMKARALTEGDVPASDTAVADSGGGFSKIEIASITSASAIVAVLLALVILYIYTRKCQPIQSRRSQEKGSDCFRGYRCSFGIRGCYKKALDPSFSPYGNAFNIVAWACMLLQKGRAREFFIEGLWDVAPHDDLVEILHLGIKCTVDSLSSRPTMKQEAMEHLRDEVGDVDQMICYPIWVRVKYLYGYEKEFMPVNGYGYRYKYKFLHSVGRSCRQRGTGGANGQRGKAISKGEVGGAVAAAGKTKGKRLPSARTESPVEARKRCRGPRPSPSPAAAPEYWRP
ncbi:hypothetical protein ABZP36_017986 [Zizania latifolia]